MDSSHIGVEHPNQAMQLNRETSAHDSALHSAMLREITNHSSKHLHHQLERSSSGSLLHRESNSTASVPDARDSVDRATGSDREPSPHSHQQADNTNLVKAALAATAEQDNAKHQQPEIQPSASAVGMPKEASSPGSHAQTAAVPVSRKALDRQAQTESALDLPAISSDSESLPAEADEAAAAAAHLLGSLRRSNTASEQPALRAEQPSGHAPQMDWPNSRSTMQVQHNGDAQLSTAVPAVAAASGRPQAVNPYEACRGYQPPLSADPDNIAAWDTPRLEQLPLKLPEPRFNAYVGTAATNPADPACKADLAASAYDSPRAAQATGGEGVVIEDSADGRWPAHVMVVCNSNVGKFLLVKQTMVCTCKLCQTKAAKMGVPFVDMTPTEFERHSGMAASKKWKYTVRIQQDGRPIGTWLEIHGYAPKAAQRERPAPSESKMATRDRNRLRDRSKSSDISGEPSASAIPLWQPQNGLSRLASGPGHPSTALTASTIPAAAPSTAPAPSFYPRSAADLLVKAAAAVNRAEALQRAEASESDVSPRSRQSGPPRLGGDQPKRKRDGREERQRAKRDRERALEADAEATADEHQPHLVEAHPEEMPDHAPSFALEPRRVRRKTTVRPQLRESSAHQAVIPNRIGQPPAPIEVPLRWEAGPSFEEAMASAKGPEKAAADLLPLDATFDPETHEGAALSSHAGRHQRALPDKRARRKPGWLDGTVDPKMAAQMAIQQATGLELDAQSDAEGNHSGGATCSNPELRWPNQRRVRGYPPARKRDRDEGDDGDMAEDLDWRGPGRVGKRNRSNREPAQPWTASTAVLHSGSGVPQALRTVPRSSSQASNARAEVDAAAVLGSMQQPQVLDFQPVNDNYLQISLKWGGRVYNGVINAIPEQHAVTGRQHPRHIGSAFIDAAPGESETMSPRLRRTNRSPRHHPAAVGCDDYDSGTHSPLAPPSGHDRGPHGPSRFAQAPRRFQTAPVLSPEQPDTLSGAQVTPPARGHNHEDGEVQSSSRQQANSAEPAVSAEACPNSERRAAIDRECARLEQEGAPEGTRCALCHGTEVDEEDGWGRQYHGLGRFILVRASTVQVAWIHSQCAWWSPKVQERNGRLEGLPAEVRRGRGLKCKECGSKGATLGCHVATCRSSFHLPCARKSNCLLLAHERDTTLTCPQHRSRAPGASYPDEQTLACYGGADELDPDYDRPNGDGARPRNLDRQGSHIRRPINRQHSGSMQVGGRPVENWELEDDAEGGVPMHDSITLKDWLRHQPARNFDPDKVPDETMAEYLGGTVSVSANRSGRCAVCVVQRKGKCGSLSAPTKCRRKQVLALRRQIQEEEHEPWLPQPAQRRRRT